MIGVIIINTSVEKKSKFSRFMVVVSLASVWFGTNVGGGFAMGRFSVDFFVRFGWTAILFPMVSTIICGVSFYYAWNFARLTKTYDYKGYVNKFYHPYEKIFGTIMDVSFLIIMCLPVGASMAGGGILINTYFGLPVIIGSAISGLIFFFFACFGSSLVNKISFWLTLVMVIALGIISISGISSRIESINTIISTREMTSGQTILSALWMAVVFAGFQSTNAPMIAASDLIKTKKEVFWATIIGIILNGVVLTAITVLLMGWYPGIMAKDVPIPILKALGDLKNSNLEALYVIALYAAYVSSGVTFLYSVGRRFSNSGLFKNLKKDSLFVKKPQLKMQVIILITTIYSFAASLFGVMVLIQKGFKYVGYLYIVLLLLPQLIVGPIKCRKLEKEASEGK